MEENRNNDFMLDDEPAAGEIPFEAESPAEPEVPVEAEIPAEPEAPVKQPTRRKPAAKPAIKKPNLPAKLPLPAIAAAAVALIVIIVLITSLGGSKRLAKNYVKASLYGDTVAMHKYLAYDNYEYILGMADEDEEDYFEILSDDMDEDIYSWKDLAKYNREEYEDYYSDEYGDDYKVEITISKVKDKSPRSIEKEYEYLLNNLEDYTDFDRDDISAGKIVEIKVKIKGDEGSDRFNYDVYLVKMGLSWNVLALQKTK